MATVPPVVRYLIVCEGVQVDSLNARKISALNVIGNIHPPSAGYPVQVREIMVLCFLTEGRGGVRVRVEISKDQDPPIYRSPEQPIQFGPDLLAVTAINFRIRGLVIPGPGMYDVRLLADGTEIASQPVRAR